MIEYVLSSLEALGLIPGTRKKYLNIATLKRRIPTSVPTLSLSQLITLSLS